MTVLHDMHEDVSFTILHILHCTKLYRYLNGLSVHSGAEKAAFQWSGHRLMPSGRMLPQKCFDLRRSEVNSRAF